MSTVVAIEDWRRQLTSKVKRLRVTATSDPSRAPDLADALLQLTAVRLQAWAFTEAAADAPESVVQAARILAAGGPVGPYAAPADAARYFTVTAQLAAVQASLGLGEAAERTLAGLDAWREQLGSLPLLRSLAPETIIWTLLARARAAGDPAAANAYADAAAAHRYRAATTPNQAVAVRLLLADCRWQAGRELASLAQHRLALAELDRLVAELPDRPRPGAVQVIATIAGACYEPYAFRLEATGRRALGLAVRRAHLELLRRFGEPEAQATAALAAALHRAGRAGEAAALDPAAQGGDLPSEPPAATNWERLAPGDALAEVDLEPGYAALIAEEQRAVADGETALASAQASEAAFEAQADAAARAEAAAAAERAEAAAAAAEREEAERAEQARLVEAAAAVRRAEAEAQARQAAEARREELAAAHAREVTAEEAAAAAAELSAARQGVAARPAGPEARAGLLERLAAALRPLADGDAEREELAGTLEELVSLHWQLGNTEASKEAARELKSLGR